MRKRFYEEAERIMAERFGKDTVIALATEENGIPHVRYVNAYYENGAFYSITYALSNKMKQLACNPVAAIAGEWFTVHGKAIHLGYFGKPDTLVIAQTLRKVFSEWIDPGRTHIEVDNCLLLCVK